MMYPAIIALLREEGVEDVQLDGPRPHGFGIKAQHLGVWFRLRFGENGNLHIFIGRDATSGISAGEFDLADPEVFPKIKKWMDEA